MRMLNCPARSPFSDSRRLPGGTRKSASVPARFNIANFRMATDSMRVNRLIRRPANKSLVSAHLNYCIAMYRY